MQKPTSPILSTDGKFDYDLAERVVRQLQASPLHVHSISVASSLPDALKTGDPYADAHTTLDFDLTLLTDGRRGFLILVTEVPEYDAAFEMTELVLQVVKRDDPGDAFVIRGATMNHLDPCERERTLRLTHLPAVRTIVERAYEEAFAGAPPIDHAAFLAPFAAYRFPVRDEQQIRDDLTYVWCPPARGS